MSLLIRENEWMMSHWLQIILMMTLPEAVVTKFWYDFVDDSDKFLGGKLLLLSFSADYLSWVIVCSRLVIWSIAVTYTWALSNFQKQLDFGWFVRGHEVSSRWAFSGWFRRKRFPYIYIKAADINNIFRDIMPNFKRAGRRKINSDMPSRIF